MQPAPDIRTKLAAMTVAPTVDANVWKGRRVVRRLPSATVSILVVFMGRMFHERAPVRKTPRSNTHVTKRHQFPSNHERQR